jgi:uncharacterized membrane protein
LTAKDDRGQARDGDGRSAARWLGIALVLSLAINAFIVGVIATRIIKIRDFRRPNPPPVVDSLADANRLLRGFPKERRADLRRVVRDKRRALRAHRDALDLARNTLADAVATDPLDVGRVDAALKAIQHIRSDMREAGRTITIDLITVMTPDERKALAERLHRRSRKKK